MRNVVPQLLYHDIKKALRWGQGITAFSTALSIFVETQVDFNMRALAIKVTNSNYPNYESITLGKKNIPHEFLDH